MPTGTGTQKGNARVDFIELDKSGAHEVNKNSSADHLQAKLMVKRELTSDFD